MPDRSVGTVTCEVLAAVRRLGGPVEIDPTPQEVPWTVPLDQDEVHAAMTPVKSVTTLLPRPRRPWSWPPSGHRTEAGPRPSTRGGVRSTSP